MSREKVRQAVVAATKEMTRLQLNDTLTTEAISDSIGIQRTTTSQYLNELVKDGTVLKIKSRPAYFYDLETVTETFFTPKKTTYDSLEELLAEYQAIEIANRPDPFQAFVGAASSLRPAIDQIKSSVYYPGTGLPFMLYGDTGVGKSLLARLTYEFCISKNLIETGAAFLQLNCAQYYHNQELLSSILFGYSKGAFTGAEEDHVGLLEAADGGVLFLDECHRLSPENQEKLFTFIDNRSFQRIGENNKTRKSNVRLIFATTENIKETFLRTFIRRIPITINIPSLNQRSSQELSELVYTFFIHESKKLAADLVISPWIMNRLLSLPYDDNVGELKNTIRLLCANAYSRQTGGAAVVINSDVLKSELLSQFLAIKDATIIEHKEITIRPDAQLSDYVNQTGSEHRIIHDLFKVYHRLFDACQEQQLNETYLIHQMAREANTVIELFVNQETTVPDASLQFLTNTIKELLSFLETNHFVKIKGNTVIALSNYLYRRNQFSMDFPILPELILEKMLAFTNRHLLVETKLINAFMELVETKLDVMVTAEEKILLSFYLKSLNLEIKQPEMHGVILAHGFSTASSMADVVNRFLDEHIFDSFDMPFNVQIDQVEEYMNRYIATNDCSKGLVILVDMGSLLILSEKLIDKIRGPLLMMNNVTTQQALFAGDMIRKNKDIQLIGQQVAEKLPMTYEVTFPKIEKQPMIITICHTGMGAALQLKEFLQGSLPEEINYIVEAADFNYIRKYGTENSLFKQYDVKAIIGTADPEIPGINYVALEDLISGYGEEKINAIFAEITNPQIRKDINNNLVRNLSIERLVSAITILDVTRVIAYIDDVIADLERHLKLTLSNSKKAILYVHIAGLVERSIRNSEELAYRGDASGEKRKQILPVIAHSLEVIEKAYNIQISTYEINYLFDIIYDC